MTRPESMASPRRLRATERQQQALELRRQGLRYDQIAQRLGISTPASWKLVMKAYQRSLRQNDELAEFNRKLDLERLDAALMAIWPQVEAGKSPAVDRLLGILERRARLLGLDSPQKQEVDIGETLARVLAELARPGGPADD